MVNFLITFLIHSYWNDLFFFISLKTAEKFKSHVKIHEKEKPFKCTKCHRCYHDETALKLHQVAHLPVLPFSCEYCHKRFRHKGLLNVNTNLYALSSSWRYWLILFSGSHTNSHRPTSIQMWSLQICSSQFNQFTNACITYSWFDLLNCF